MRLAYQTRAGQDTFLANWLAVEVPPRMSPSGRLEPVMMMFFLRFDRLVIAQ
jgi:hypothetical protein